MDTTEGLMRKILAEENQGAAIIKRESFIEQTETVYVSHAVVLRAMSRAYEAGRANIPISETAF